MTNPLSDYFRKPETTVVLPAGKWYAFGDIEFVNGNEVPVYSMLPAEEIMMINPEALVSGVAIIEILKSCCPAVKNPSKLFYPDVNALLLGIHRATYGSKITQGSYCPHCIETKNKVILDRIEQIIKEEKLNIKEMTQEDGIALRARAEKDVAKQLTDMVEKNEFNDQPVETTYEYDSLVAMTNMLPDEKIVEINGLKIYCTPFRLEDKVKFVNLELKQNRIMKEYQDHTANQDFINDEYINVVEGLMNQYKELSDMSVDTLSSAILKIGLPDGSEVCDNGYISEFLHQQTLQDLNKLRDAVRELTGTGVPSMLDYECPVCGHKWQAKFNGYNQTDFFGVGSEN